jgi:hypothetical protein
LPGVASAFSRAIATNHRVRPRATGGIARGETPPPRSAYKYGVPSTVIRN